MGEVLRQTEQLDEHSSVMSLLRILKGGETPGNTKIQQAIMMIIRYTEDQITHISDIGTIYRVLQGLQALLETLPGKPRILDEWEEKETSVSEKRKKISERLRLIQVEWHEQGESARPDFEQEATISAGRSLIIEAFAAEQREWILESERLKMKKKAGQNVDRDIAMTEAIIRRNFGIWKREVSRMREVNPSPLSEQRRILEMRLAGAFGEEPTHQPVLSEDEKRSELQRREREIEAWIKQMKLENNCDSSDQNVNPSPTQTETMTSEEELSWYRRCPERVVDTGIGFIEDLSENLSSIPPNLINFTRKRLMMLLTLNNFQNFLGAAKKITADCARQWAELKNQKRLTDEQRQRYETWKRIAETTHDMLPAAGQVSTSNLSKEDMELTKHAIWRCLNVMGVAEEELNRFHQLPPAEVTKVQNSHDPDSGVKELLKYLHDQKKGEGRRWRKKREE
ncbi:MAG: hypothetical protein AB7J40_01620 [Candidatus Altimarinota bacterium]